MPQYKIVFLGDSGVGKTAYLHRMVTGDWQPEHIPTTGFDVHTVDSPNKNTIYYSVWDTQGGDPGSAMQIGACVAADAAFIFYDLRNPDSVENLIHYYNVFRTICNDAPVIVIGAKLDQLYRPIGTPADKTLLATMRKVKKFVWDNNLFHVRIATIMCRNWDVPWAMLEGILSEKTVVESDDLIPQANGCLRNSNSPISE